MDAGSGTVSPKAESLLATQLSSIVRRAVCGTALASLLGGCLSVSYVDSSNRRHVIGFVDVVVDQAAPGSEKSEPAAVSIMTVGVHMYSGAPGGGSGVIVGYAQETTVLMPNNSCISLEKPGACPTTPSVSSSALQAKESKP